MAWVRIHDGAMDNPKIMALTDSAFRLWVRALSYCQTQLTDGLIPREALRKMGAKRRDVELLTTPVDESYAPLWETIPDFGFKVHDYLFWNDSREKVRDKQKKAKARLDAWKAKRDGGNAVGNAVPNAVPNAVLNGVENASLTKPNQTKPKKEQKDNNNDAAGHRRHAYCPPPGSEGFCVPEFLHGEFVAQLGHHADSFDLLRWYVDTDQVRRDQGIAVDSPLDWWRSELRRALRERGLTKPPARAIPSHRPAYVPFECPHEPKCTEGRWRCEQKTALDAARRAG